MNEQDFIGLLQKGDAQAFKMLVQTWQDMVFNTILSIVQDNAEAEDLSQETFVQVFRSVHTFRADAKLSTWLYRIAVSKALDAERRKQRQKRAMALRSWIGFEKEEQAEPVHFHHPGVQFDNKEKAAMLFKAMKQLPESQRAAFVLIKAEGLGYEETAAILQTTVKAVESLMHRAKENLRKQLKQYYQQ